MSIITNVMTNTVPKKEFLPVSGKGLRWAAIGADRRVFALFAHLHHAQEFVDESLNKLDGAYVASIVE